MALITDHMDSPNPPGFEDIPAERVWDMLSSIDIAMLVTRTGEGLRGRPMSTIPRADKTLIYILTETNSSAANDIRADGGVFLSYQGNGDHVALRGRAQVDPDKDLVKALWNPGAQAFWPEGPETHEIVVLVVDPGHADVWDGKGTLRGIVNIVKSMITGTKPDVGDRGVVDL